jgi:hypothetical protein
MKGSQGDTPEAVGKDAGAAYRSVQPCSVAWPTLEVDGRERQHGGFPKGRGRRARRPASRRLRGTWTDAIAGAGDIAGVSYCECDGSRLDSHLPWNPCRRGVSRSSATLGSAYGEICASSGPTRQEVKSSRRGRSERPITSVPRRFPC